MHISLSKGYSQHFLKESILFLYFLAFAVREDNCNKIHSTHTSQPECVTVGPLSTPFLEFLLKPLLLAAIEASA